MGITIQPKETWITETSSEHTARMKAEREEKERLLKAKREKEKAEIARIWEEGREERERLQEIFRLQREAKAVERARVWEEGREERERLQKELEVKASKIFEEKAYEEYAYRKRRSKLDKKLSKKYKKLISQDIDTSPLDYERLTYAEKTEIIEFGKLCAGTQLPDLKRKFVTVNKHITDHNLWDRFPTIRAKLTFSSGGRHKGISTEYYRIAMNLLGSETCNTGTHVTSSESF